MQHCYHLTVPQALRCHCGLLVLLLPQVQTLYYLGPAGTARKRTAASASQGNSAAGEVTAADLEADAAQANAEVAVAKKGSKKTKRRKKGGQAAEATEKENEQPAAAPAVAIIKKAIPESDGNPEVRPDPCSLPLPVVDSMSAHRSACQVLSNRHCELQLHLLVSSQKSVTQCLL